PGGEVLINAPDGTPVIGGAFTVPATDLALRHVGRPVPNAALLGGFAAATGRLRLESVVAAIRGRFPERVAAGNVAAAREAYEMVRAQRSPSEASEVSHA